MLLEEYDECLRSVINPENFIKKIDGFPETCVSFFSYKLMDEFIKVYKPIVIAEMKNTSMVFPVYKINVEGVDIAVYQSPVGAPACVGNLEDIVQMGAKRLVLVGSCGCLYDDIEDYSIIIPTSAIRDEGTSYHYMKANDEVELDKKNIEIIEKVIKDLGFNYSKGKTWTTDAFYRETPQKVLKRKNQGAIVVEMECSAMAVVAKFRNVEFAQLFYGADSLAGELYDIRSLSNYDISKQGRMIPIAIKCAIEMQKANK